jgi:hypothetical protein
MLTRSMLLSAAHSQRRRSHLRPPTLSAVLAWLSWQRRHSATMMSRVDRTRADHIRRYRANRWL